MVYKWKRGADMLEHQKVEWKETWHDEYLKWICGYANAYGGVLYIGKDDSGSVVGINNSRSLLEGLPNKITDMMGIVADVNMKYEGSLEYLEIRVDKYPSLISFRGKYYYRSGSTMREITGKELDKAIFKSQGKTWDGISLPKIRVEDLKQDAINLFKKKSIDRGRLTEEAVQVNDVILMEDLHLVDEDGNLLRAAMLAFYDDPEKWVTGSYIKIGYFGKSDSDLLYQDEIHGPLIEQVDKTVELIYTKYLKAWIDYKGIQRTEQYMFHQDAFREILLNAIVHKDYSGCNPIQISVYDDKIYIWNDGTMPSNLTSTEKLFEKHSSKPYNPKLADVFFKSGMIEAWGRGFDKIKEACEKYNGPLPEYSISEDGIMVLCKACDRYLKLKSKSQEIHSIVSEERIMSEYMSDYMSEKTKSSLEKITKYLEENTEVTNAIGQKLTGKSPAQVRRYLKILCNLGVIKSNEGTKGNVYLKQ